jgi:spermidine synthase
VSPSLTRQRRIHLYAAALLGLLAGISASADQKLIHSEKSLYRDVFVYDNAAADGTTRCLCFTKLCAIGRQTCIDLKQPNKLVFEYTRMMLGALYLKPDPHDILIIGLGGGTLPRTLEQLLPQADIDVVEIDPAVVGVAEQYFGFKPDERVHLIVQDGRAYARQSLRDNRHYDLIILDAYEHQYIPEHMLTREFLTEVGSLLAPSGIVAANTFSSSRLYNNESVTYASVYGTFYNLRSGNRVILASNAPLPSIDDATRNSRLFAAAFEPYGVTAQMLLPMFSTRPDWDTKARVLTDQYSPSNLLNGPP